ncbi:MAG: hypothetical protein ACFFCW_31410 [Candidatus Hodarchaeota archaeon]
MKKIRVVAVLIICFALFLLTVGRVSGEEIPSVWCTPIDGEIHYMISFPYIPEDRDVLGQLVDDLGPYDPTQWRLFRYDPEGGIYVELRSTDWIPPKHDFDYGRGYWIISRDPKEICIDGAPVTKNWIILDYRRDGWNQIGDIYDYDFPIVSLYVARASTPLDRKQLIDPVNNDLTYVTLQEYENGQYIDIPTFGKASLEVGKAYWLRVREGVGEDVVLWFLGPESNTHSKEIYLSQEFFERVAQQEGPPNLPPGLLGPDIEANGSDGPLTIPQGENLTVTIALDPGSYDGKDADWWVTAKTPFGRYWYTSDRRWIRSDAPIRVHGGPLFDLSPREVLNKSSLPVGGYTFYFGVDLLMNGSLNRGQLYFDRVGVTIE